MVKCFTFKEIIEIIDLNFSKDVLAKTLSGYFLTKDYERKKIRIRLHKSEMKNHPFLYLAKLLLFCEKNRVSPSILRILYVDSVGSLQDNFIKKRFPDFKASIFFISGRELHMIPNVPKIDDVYTIIIIDNSKFSKNFMAENCDMEVRLVLNDDDH